MSQSARGTNIHEEGVECIRHAEEGREVPTAVPQAGEELRLCMCKSQAQEEEVVDHLRGCSTHRAGVHWGLEDAVEVTVEGDMPCAQLENNCCLLTRE